MKRIKYFMDGSKEDWHFVSVFWCLSEKLNIMI